MEKVTTVRNQLQSCAKKTHKENKILINKVTACGSITSRNKQVCFYRPQRSWGKVMFFTRVCDSVHRGGVCPIACWDRPPSPRSRHPPPEEDTPGEQTPQYSACWEIRATSGRYASYWNAILFILLLLFSRFSQALCNERRSTSRVVFRSYHNAQHIDGSNSQLKCKQFEKTDAIL